MREYISIFDALVITVFSISIVFISLIIIAYLINGLKIISSDKNKKIKQSIENNIDYNIANEVTVKKEDDEELVAVIAAAIASSLGVGVPDINIRSIKRIQQNTSVWAEMGKKEQMSGRL